jgi:hypothetical protein
MAPGGIEVEVEVAGVRSRSESVERRSVQRRGGVNPLASTPL